MSLFEKIPNKYSDITIEINGKKYFLHKLILSNIPFFDKLFSSEFLERKIDYINLNEISQESFEKIVSNLYSEYNKLRENFSNNILSLKMTLDDIDAMDFLGLNHELKTLSNKWEGDLKHGTIYNFIDKKWLIDINMLENYLYVKRYDKIPINLVEKSAIADLFGKAEISEYPYTLYHYLALQKIDNQPYNTFYDLSEIYHSIFGGEGFVLHNDIINRYINEKINWSQNIIFDRPTKRKK